MPTATRPVVPEPEKGRFLLLLTCQLCLGNRFAYPRLTVSLVGIGIECSRPTNLGIAYWKLQNEPLVGGITVTLVRRVRLNVKGRLTLRGESSTSTISRPCGSLKS